MSFTIAWKQPAFRTPVELLCHSLSNLGQQEHSAWFLELGIDGLNMQVSFAEINVLCLDLGHLAYTQASSCQQ